MKGKYIIISAPSAAGKSTLIRAIRKTCSDCNLAFSVSMTTRQPRPGEVDGVHYFFVTHEEFKESVNKGHLLEWQEVHGNFYGTPKEPVENLSSAGKNVILDVDVKGGWNIKHNTVTNSLAIFIMPPSKEELRKRLVLRGTETEDQINKRMERVEEEIAYAKDFDKVIVNDVLSASIEELTAIIREYLNK